MRVQARNRFRWYTVVAAVTVGTVIVSACSSSGSSGATGGGGGQASGSPAATSIPGITQAEVTAANKEGKLTIYETTAQDSENAVISGFEKAFPDIKVSTFSATASELQEKYVDEANSGNVKADIVQNASPTAMTQEAKQGMFLHYVSSQDSAYTSSLKDSGYWYAIRLNVTAVAWNTNNVSDSEAATITSYSALTDPRWKGKIGLVDPSSGGVDYMPWYLWLTSPSLGKPFLQKLAANSPRVYSASQVAGSALASGAISVLPGISESGLLPLLSQGAPLEWKFLSPTGAVPTGQAIMAKAPDPAAAKLFQDYSLSAVGAGLYQANEGGLPTRIGQQDLRAVAKESWYKLPTQTTPYSNTAFNAEPSVLAEFNSLFQ